jgi:tetratricopeptide (TPR) repeat protein
MKKLYFLTLLSAVLFTACKTPGKAYDKGDYNTAIELAVKGLQKNPSDGEYKSIAQNAYKQAIADHQTNIRQLSGSSSDNRFEQIYNEYVQMQKLYNLIRQQPSLMTLVKPTDYTEYIATYKDKAGEVHYEKGMARMDEQSKRAYREAYVHFQKALKFKPNDAVLRRKADETYNLATVHVVVLPMNDFYGGGNRYDMGGMGSSYGGYANNSYLLRNFEDQVVRNLRFNTGNNFVKFYSEWDARSARVEPDEILEMRLGRMIIGQPFDQQQTRNASREIVVKETYYKPDSVVRQTARVNAQVIITRRTLVSEGDLYITSRDAKGRILWSDIFRGEHRWQTEFATYRGDERALSENDRSLMNRSNAYNTPREDEIVQQVLAQIENEMSYRLRNNYSRYY